MKRAEEYPESDFRRNDPRYQGENFDANVRAASASGEEMAALDAALAPGKVAGPRYGQKQMAPLDR